LVLVAGVYISNYTTLENKLLPDQIIYTQINNIFINNPLFYCFHSSADTTNNSVLRYFYEKALSLRKDIDSLNRFSSSNKWTAEMNHRLLQTVQFIDLDLKHSPIVQDMYEAARQTISIFVYTLANSIPHHTIITKDAAKNFFINDIFHWQRVTDNCYFYAFEKPARTSTENKRNTFEVITQKNCNPQIAFEYYFPNMDLTLKIIQTACLISSKKENTWSIHIPYLLQHLACLRSSHIFTDLYNRSEPTNREKLSLQMNLKISKEEEVEMLKDKTHYQIYLFLLFRQYVTVYPSIPYDLIGKQNYHDHNYYQRVKDTGKEGALYNLAWKKIRNKLYVDSSESYNGANELMVMASKKEIFELIPYDSK